MAQPQALEHRMPDVYEKADARWDACQAEMPVLIDSLPPTPPGSLVSLDWPAARAEQVCAALVRDGAVIVRNAVPAETCERLRREMAPYVEETPLKGSMLDPSIPKATRRTGAVLARSRASWELAAHPLVMEVCDGFLGRQVASHDTQHLEAVRLAPHPAHSLQLSRPSVCGGWHRRWRRRVRGSTTFRANTRGSWS